tara:strand:- start:670 stop:858 length:189 start_codon:yes stop_codon:yes gene_type:complete
MNYKDKFKMQERVIIVDGMIKGVVVDYYNKVGERVIVKTENGHRWLIKPEDLVHESNQEAEE